LEIIVIIAVTRNKKYCEEKNEEFFHKMDRI